MTFEDSQRVQNIREQLIRTLVLLDAHLEVAAGCRAHCQTLDVCASSCLSHELITEVENYSFELRIHRSATNAALERSQGTLHLVGEAPFGSLLRY